MGFCAMRGSAWHAGSQVLVVQRTEIYLCRLKYLSGKCHVWWHVPSGHPSLCTYASAMSPCLHGQKFNA